MTTSRALLVVDVLIDFVSGALPVPGANRDEYFRDLNDIIREFSAEGAPVCYIGDSHPVDHCSFVAQGGKWPPHAVAGMLGAQWDRRVYIASRSAFFRKGMTARREEYSGFANGELLEYLTGKGVTDVTVVGLALDYCVESTALDARVLHFNNVTVIKKATRAVDLACGDAACTNMQASGVVVKVDANRWQPPAGTWGRP